VKLAMARSSVVPKEHGAWAMLLIPLLIGFGAAGRVGPEALLFLGAVVLFFMARYHLGLLARKRPDQDRLDPAFSASIRWATVFIALGGLFGLALVGLYQRWGLLPLAGSAAIFLLLDLYLQRRRLDRTTWGELIGIAGLSITGPGAYIALLGVFDKAAFALWLLPFLYSGSSVFYVKMKVRQRLSKKQVLSWGEKWSAGATSALYLGLLLAVTAGLSLLGAVPLFAGLAFLPLVGKVGAGIGHLEPNLSIRRLGLRELAYSLLFATLLVLIFHLSPYFSPA
jgi:hypothetical protein